MSALFTLFMSFVALALCGWLATPLHRMLGLDGRSSRIGYIDGLRGYLALLVCISHFALTYRWQHGADWLDPMERYLTNFGQSAVALFFIITGFLFFGRVFSQGKALNWRGFFISRLFRIYPLYLVVVALIFLLSLLESGFDPGFFSIQNAKALVQWLTFSSTPIMGNMDAPVKIAHVEWTLRFEAAFYLMLPLLALTFHKARWIFFAIATAAIWFCFSPTRIELVYLKFGTQFFVLFFAGALLAWITPVIKEGSVNQWISQGWVGALSIGLWLVMILTFDSSYGLIQTVILTAIAIPVTCGNSWLGLLSTRGSVALGEISYSIYLGHGLVLYLIYTTAMPSLLTSMSFNQALWLLPITALMVCAASAVSHWLIERPGMSVGKALSRRT